MAQYSRLYLADLYPSSVKKVLYLDCDTIVLSSIEEIWNINLGDNIIAALNDAFSSLYRRNIGLRKTDIMFNSGVMLIDLDKWSFLILIGLVIGSINGNIVSMSDSILASSKEAIELCILMFGVVGLWSGIMNVAVSLGIITKLQPVPVAGGVAHLVHNIDGVAPVGEHRLVQGDRLHNGLQGQHHVLPLHGELLGDLLHGGLPVLLGGQALLALDGLVGRVPQGTADPHGVVVPQKSPHLPDNHGHPVGGELHPLVHVEVVDGLHQPNAPHLEQVVGVFPPVAKPLDDREHQPQVPGNQLLYGKRNWYQEILLSGRILLTFSPNLWKLE